MARVSRPLKAGQNVDLSPDGDALRVSVPNVVTSSTTTRIVALTQAQYDALPTKDATTLYSITDAGSGSAGAVIW